MEKIYNPKDIEEQLYNFWEKNGYFQPNHLKQKTFCIMLPPPNVTGSLHMGHAFQQTIMDILIRYHRMQGKNTFWQVGTDHAGIATQILVEQKLYLEENKTKKDYGREKFIEKVWHWKKTSHKLITRQMRRLGISVDWNHEKFTLDSDISYAVNEAFIRLYKNNLIYRKKKLVHWDSKLETVVSDLEVEHRSQEGKIWFIKYPIFSKSNIHSILKYVVVATTRPETLLGDTAIAVNPKNSLYRKYIGEFAICPIVNRKIPIIGDEYVQEEYGSGCVKITPAHDFNDYIIACRHKLSMINIFTTDGKIKSVSEVYDYKGKKSYIYNTFIPLKFQKLDIFSARIEVIKEIERLGLLDSIQKCNIMIPYSSRSNTVILPMLTNQWYLKMSELSIVALDCVERKQIKFVPEQYKNMYSSWMKHIEDWCISRQLWWGHRIPIWYDKKQNIYVGHNEKEIRKTHNLEKTVVLRQDNDVLDTWFSSGLWTFSSLGWPKKTKFLKIFHPTNVLVSGFDIIFFWIARMIMLTMYLVKDQYGNSQIPFKKIYITGLIRDEKGKKMSKSIGNVIDPLDMIDGISLDQLINKRTSNLLNPKLSQDIKQRTVDQFPKGIKPTGTDALRFTFASLASNTRNIHWDMNRLKGYRNFCNKLWNASRFVFIHTKDHRFSDVNNTDTIPFIHKWILIELNRMVEKYRHALDNYRFDMAANILYDFTWNIFCDWYLEFSKLLINGKNNQDVYCTKNILIYVLEILLRLAHPIIPFITETIWQRIKNIQKIKKDSIMLQKFPTVTTYDFDHTISTHMHWIQKIIIFLRNIRKKMKLGLKKQFPLFLYNVSCEKKIIIEENMLILKKIANLHMISIIQEKNGMEFSIKKIIDDVEVIIPILDIIDKKLELKRLKKELKITKVYLIKIQEKILNKKFLLFAPKNIVIQEQQKFLKLNEKYKKLSSQIQYLQN